MKTLQFKCTLLSDVILNQKAASDGVNKTLDFIPGSNFLGIVAGKLYETLPANEAWEIFHSGHVRFGDAHPSLEDFRGLKVPAAIMQPKLKSDDNKNYIHFRIPDPNAESIKKLQLKQCRTGFYDFSKTEAQQIATKTSFAVKSAYNRNKRRSEDEKMFGYESLRQGLIMFFEVQVDNDDFAKTISDALVGKCHIGRSRTAQYGLVEIEECKYAEVKSNNSSNDEVIVYADSRLIFLDEFGLPTFQPSPKDLGIDDEKAKICWEESQVRTFKYAPYNYKRQCFDADRCGIEKGSVFVIKMKEKSGLQLQSQYVGSYKNEGFGKVIYNPGFLQAEPDGKAKYKLNEAKEPKEPEPQEIDTKGNTLLNYLVGRKNKEKDSNDVYKIVNEWIKDYGDTLFKGKEKFASQWGTIRAFAMANQLNDKIVSQIEEYISHGVKAEDWLGNRRDKLKEFMTAHKNNNNFREMMVNLAAQMAKKCKKEDKQ